MYVIREMEDALQDCTAGRDRTLYFKEDVISYSRLIFFTVPRLPHLQRGPRARLGRGMGVLRGKPRRLRGQLGRENALQARGEEMQELWHLSRTHCGCQQTNLGYLHQWKN